MELSVLPQLLHEFDMDNWGAVVGIASKCVVFGIPSLCEFTALPPPQFNVAARTAP